MKYQIKDRWSGDVKFTADINCDESAPQSVKKGLAVKWAVENGADLRDANLIGANLRDADLRGADLSGADLRCAYLRDADLSDADLRYADLRDADLRYADLRDADLRYADLSGDWVPVNPHIHTTVYEAASKENALDMSNWHQGGHFCGTTHCRAGWVTHLAGEGGRVMDGMLGTNAAAALIYMKSDPSMEKIPNWVASDDEALADMKQLADAEKAVQS